MLMALLLILAHLTLGYPSSASQMTVKNLLAVGLKQSTPISHTCQYSVNNFKNYSTFSWTNVLSQTQNWTDPNFNLSQNIYWSDVPNSLGSPDLTQYQFARVKDVLRGSNLFGLNNQANPGAAVQGIYGDCFFVSSASGLSENPYRVNGNFLTNYTNQGMIVVRAVVLGVQANIPIDDYLAFQSGSPIFSKPADYI